MQFRTNISKTASGVHSIRGHDVSELIAKRSFSDVIFLLLRGTMPNARERWLLEALLVAAAENGIEAPSVYIPRIAASTGASFEAAIASGILAVGKHHGGAVREAAELLWQKKSPVAIVADFSKRHTIIPGFGHPIYKNEDPRAAALYARAKALGFSCTYFKKAHAIARLLEKKKGKVIPVNVDGALAAAALELGFDRRITGVFFLLSRIVGAAAHVHEELLQENRYHRLEPGDIIAE